MFRCVRNVDDIVAGDTSSRVILNNAKLELSNAPQIASLRRPFSKKASTLFSRERIFAVTVEFLGLIKR